MRRYLTIAGRIAIALYLFWVVGALEQDVIAPIAAAWRASVAIMLGVALNVIDRHSQTGRAAR